MKLFTERIRQDAGVKRADETDFEFLDRCSWASMEEVRQFLKECLDGFEREHRPDLIARVRSGDQRHFRSATTEMVLHAFLRKQGFELIPHPDLPNGSPKKPDFLVTSPQGNSIYLEAVSASEDDGDDSASEARKARTLQLLEQTSHSTFVLEMHSSGSPTTQPSGKRLVREVLEWLNGLDPDALLADRLATYEGHPKKIWSHENWTLTFEAIPRPVRKRDTKARLIGIRSFEARMVDGWTPIRDAIIEKASRYGSLDLPLIVAVNVNAFNLDEIDALQAVLGRERFALCSGSPPNMCRAPDGAWFGPKGVQYTRCSGAWLLGDLRPYSIANLRQALYLHPAAQRPVPEDFLCMPHISISKEDVVKKPGKTFAEVFGFSNSWPE